MKNTIISLLFTFCFLAHHAYSQTDPKARVVLDKMSEKYRKLPSFRFNISQQLINESEHINETFDGSITVKGNKFRLKLGEQEVYNNNVTVWTFIKDANEVNIEESENDESTLNPVNIFDAYKEGYHYAYLKESILGGKKYDIIDLSPKDKDLQFYKIRMQINQQTAGLKKFIMFDKNGNQYIYKISKFDPTVNVGDDYFVFDEKKHPGVEVVDLR